MNENEFATFEERNYLSPTVSRDEQLQFVDTLRDTMSKNQAQISADTYALGSQLPSNLGGLGGASETFTARYQTPYVQQTAADLRKAAQQTALNQALTNYQNAWKKRYNDAMMKYQQRAAAASSGGGGGTGGDEQQGFQFNTNSGSSTDLGVRYGQNDYDSGAEQFNKAAAEAAKQQQSGNFNTANSVAFSYVDANGNTVHGVIYRDTFGNITGVSTPSAEYNAQNGKNFLMEHARKGTLKNSAGQTMTDFNVLFAS